MRLDSRLFLVLLCACGAGCFDEPTSAPVDTPASNNSTIASTNNSTGSTGSECVESDELCDGVDNDCDGEVDEEFSLGELCEQGVGACLAEGEVICSDDGGTTCDAVAVEPGDELCGDDIDNDCDGDVDEGFVVGTPCTVGMGACASDGLLRCSDDGRETVCDAEIVDPPEDDERTCDGLDNDCDGAVDEGCDDDDDGVCEIGFTLVSPGGDAVCVAEGDCDDADDEVYPGAPGLCDGKDNDCDGGVDDIKRTVTHPRMTSSETLAASLSTSPIQVVPRSFGFCFMATAGPAGARTRVFGEFLTSTDQEFVTVDQPGGERRVADVEWSGGTCAGIEVLEDGDSSLDIAIARWNGLVSAEIALLVDDGIFRIGNSWDAALAFAAGRWAVGYSTTSGSDADYVSVRETFAASDSPATPRFVGLNGQFPEFGTHPGAGYQLLFASNFASINFHRLDIGSAADPAGAPVRISGAASHRNLIMNSVDGQTWYASFDGTDWDIRRIAAGPVYDVAGAIVSGAGAGQEFLTRNAFTLGPDGALWFVDSVSDQVQEIALDGAGGFTATHVSDPAAQGYQLLAGRQVSPDVVELFWLVSPGDGTTGFQYEIAEYTCH